jgi:hypothetical protein
MDERLELLTALEACRPASDDLEAPELAALAAEIQRDPDLARRFEATQRWDAAVRQGLQQGSVPEGLESRILAALEVGHVSPADSAGSASPAKHSRRGWWMGLAVAVTVAAVAVGAAVWGLFGGTDPLTPGTIQERAAAWSDSLPATEWRNPPFPHTEYPFAAEVRPDPSAWQAVSLPNGLGRGVAYRIPPPPGANIRQMTLFVLKADAAGLGPFPPTSPHRTMDHLVAAWQIGDHVYVLVLQGDDLSELQRLYQQSVNTSGKFI